LKRILPPATVSPLPYRPHATCGQRYRYSAGADSEFERSALAREGREKIRDRLRIVALPVKEIINFGDSLSISGFIVLGHAWTKSKCLPGVKRIDPFREAADDVSSELVGRARESSAIGSLDVERMWDILTAIEDREPKGGRRMTRTIPMRNGIFLAPFHPLDQDPTEALHRDLELVENLDRLGYEEAWIGEHHSAGFEIIASPEVFIAAAAERTKKIRLGTGVVSLPYHNPLMTANRMIQLDHQTRGRVMFGVGPGLLPSDAMMLGINPMTQRDRMMEGLKVIMRLFNGEVVTEKSDWYNLVNARAHLLPYTKPHPEIAVASAVSPSGGRAAGKYGFGMLCVAATNADGFDALSTNWQIANEIAAENGRTMDRSRLRLVGPVHLAETREQARKNVEYGIHKFMEYFARLNPLAPTPSNGKNPIDDMIESGRAVIGTPDDAIAQLKRLETKQGEFGAFLQLAHNWASFDKTIKSYELWAAHVAPVFKNANVSRQASYDWTMSNAHDFMGQAMNAASAMIQKHAEERASKRAGTEGATATRRPSK